MMSEPKEHTPAYKIFHYHIQAYIPVSYANRGLEKLIGSPVYRSKEEELEALNQKVLKQLTTAQLIELHRVGCPIIFHDPKDTVRVYRYIKDHIRDIESRSTNILHTNKIPLEDLMAMDDFAESLHGVARIHSSTRVGNTMLGRKLDNLMASRGLRRNEVTKEETVYGEHKSMITNISRIALERNLGDVDE